MKRPKEKIIDKGKRVLFVFIDGSEVKNERIRGVIIAQNFTEKEQAEAQKRLSIFIDDLMALQDKVNR